MSVAAEDKVTVFDLTAVVLDEPAARAALRDLVGYARARGARTWWVMGELPATKRIDNENDWVVLHDGLGRLAVRLAIDKVIGVGENSRAVRALHQGAVMEGSWGGEAILAAHPAEALDLLRTELRNGDIVAVVGQVAAGPGIASDLDLSVVTRTLLDNSVPSVREGAPDELGAGMR